MGLTVNVTIPKMDGQEIAPGIFLIGEPTPRPDLGENKMACLGNVRGQLCVLQLSVKFIAEHAVPVKEVRT